MRVAACAEDIHKAVALRTRRQQGAAFRMACGKANDLFTVIRLYETGQSKKAAI